MKARRSFLYYDAIAEEIGLEKKEAEIKSIWEDELLGRVHPEDLQKKYRLEFQFFQLLNSIDIRERMDYQVITKLRIRNKDGKYILIQHRLIYIGNSKDGSMRLSLCLYNMIYDHPEFEIPQGAIVNIKTGKIIDHNQQRFIDILSSREKEVLQLIKHGRRSKEIAVKLGLSINTVNRHRQNIFQKLNVTNVMEACRVAESTGIL
ncbi:response regulator transcription factor [Pedobacter sp. R-06]|uniref:response regulator transcription factor n=1 Tax=Pedobacter sp. R-06 TaxID=3404051 RepID=UPI003CEE5FB9